MPRMGTEIYAVHMDNVLKLARRECGVSRPELMNELKVTRAVANGLIEKCKLELARKDGRTEYFKANGAAAPPIKPPEAKAVAVPVSDDTGDEPDDLEALAELDADIVDTRNALRAAAKLAGAALGDWATHSALVDAMRERLIELATKRMAFGS